MNPYQPPLSAVGEVDPTAPTQVSFQLNRRLGRYAEAQYLLHWRPNLMLFSSLAMILGSCIVLVVTVSYTPTAFLPTLASVLVISATIYSALVYPTKEQVRRGQQEHGLTLGKMITLQFDSERMTLVAAGQTYVWPNHQLSIYRTGRGLLICPEPLFFVFIPKNSSFELKSYQRFVALVRSRAPAQD